MEKGTKVIVRGDRSGVYYGVLKEKNGSQIEFERVRKLYYWSGAACVEQLALEGVKNPNECKFTVFVENMIIEDAIQTIPCTERASKCIEGVIPWKK